MAGSDYQHVFSTLDNLVRRLDDRDVSLCEIRHVVREVSEIKAHLTREASGLSLAKSAIKTINQRLSSFQFAIARLLDRIEVLEKTSILADAVRSTKSAAAVASHGSLGLDGFLDGVVAGDGGFQTKYSLSDVAAVGENRRRGIKRSASDDGGGPDQEVGCLSESLDSMVRALCPVYILIII